MIYDEGFQIEDGQQTIFVFSKFFEKAGQHKSDCSASLTGWYHDFATNQVACVKGSKVGDKNEDDQNTYDNDINHDFVVQPKDTFTDTDSNSFLQLQKPSKSTPLP